MAEILIFPTARRQEAVNQSRRTVKIDVWWHDCDGFFGRRIAGIDGCCCGYCGLFEHEVKRGKL